MSNRMFLPAACASAALLLVASANADQVINDDLIVTGSICVGFDCVNGEVFDSDTIRLKENNTRIQFNDTSVGAFPTNNWQIRANSNASGGPSFLGFVDQGAGGTGEAGNIVFQVTAGAPANALFVSSSGRVGFGTSVPSTNLHVVTGNTPTLRLDQNATAGFAAQVWDVAGNEANFFIRDVTGGSRLPFRSRPGAPTSSIDIAADGDVGMGTSSPGARLHVFDNAGSGALDMLRLENNGNPQIILKNTNNGAEWEWGAGQNFVVEERSGGAGVVFTLTPTGNLTIGGTLTELSDKNAKMAIEPIDSAAILAKVSALPVSAWTYKHDAENGTRHIGPMAQDFYALFGTGATETGISTMDTSGVALAAIQALNARIEALEAELALLR